MMAFFRSVPTEAYVTALVAIQSAVAAWPLLREPRDLAAGVFLCLIGAVMLVLSWYQWHTRNDKLDYFLPSFSANAVEYRSIARITNLSTSEGTATFSLRDMTAKTIATFSKKVPSLGTTQIMAGDIEQATGLALPRDSSLNARIEGDFVGSVEHILWNSGVGVFSKAGEAIRMPKYPD